jgi:hypothetical protein
MHAPHGTRYWAPPQFPGRGAHHATYTTIGRAAPYAGRGRGPSPVTGYQKTS